MRAVQEKDRRPSDRARGFRQRLLRAAGVSAGLAAVQLFLAGPCFLGHKLYLPLDVLAMEGYYLPRTPEYRAYEPRNPVLSDQVLIYEPQRRFAAAELRAGRVPFWSPGQYGGAPSTTFAKYSPFHLLYYLFPAPGTLIWIHLLQVLVAGLGAYVFFRRSVAVSYWPAVVGAWCFPLGGFFVLWQGYPFPAALAWFPWLLWVIEGVLERPRGAFGPLLAALTAVLLLSGQIDFSAQVLLASGLYAAARLIVEYRRGRRPRRLLAPASALAAAWALGILLAAPFLGPILDYMSSSSRMSARGSGFEERPPVGAAALPATVLPDYYGAMRAGSVRLVDGNRMESSAGAYAGLVAALLLAPLAWTSRRHRPQNAIWLALGFLGLAWVLNVPLLVTVLRLPGINMLSHNRFVFVTGFALAVMATVALERLRGRALARRWWFLVPALALLALGAWCVRRAERPPEPLATQLESLLAEGSTLWTLRGPEDLARARQSFRAANLTGALWCGLAAAGWVLASSAGRRPWLAPAIAGLWLAELLAFAHGLAPQSEPELYYPRLPILERLAAAAPGRLLGMRCLPPRLAESQGFADLRGIDGIEPERALKVLRLAQDTRFPSPPYARTFWYVPQIRRTADGRLDLPPVLDMLGLRYLVFRGPPDPAWRPFAVAADYWALENRDALPRVFVPGRVETVRDGEEILRRMLDFDPREVAFVERPLDLPDRRGDSGSAAIAGEVPGRIEVAYDVPSPALVVLAENWDGGWRVSVDGRRMPSVRADYTLNAAVVPAGRGRLTFSYRPPSWGRDLLLAALALVACGVWLGWLGRNRDAQLPVQTI